MRIVVFDIDGTLANIEHRLHLIKNVETGERLEKPNWDEFNRMCLHDKPVWPLVNMGRELGQSGWRVILVSGRSRKAQEQTDQWLNNNLIYYDELYMRDEGDFRPDYQVKREIYETHLKHRRDQIQFVIDDRQQVVDLWRELGLICLQCQEGDY